MIKYVYHIFAYRYDSDIYNAFVNIFIAKVEIIV